MRNFISTMMVSQGIPMIDGGDEIMRTQQGNNNAYCQDNPISWTHWDLDERRQQLHDFTQKMIHLRLRHPVLHRRKFFDAEAEGNNAPQVEWFDHTGSVMDQEDWDNTNALTLMVFLNGHAIPEADVNGNQIKDNDFILIFNAYYEPMMFRLPGEKYGRKWRLLVDTHDQFSPELAFEANFGIMAQARSFMLLVSDEDDISGTTHQVQEIKVIEKPQDNQDNSPAADTGTEASSPAGQAEDSTGTSATLPG